MNAPAGKCMLFHIAKWLEVWAQMGMPELTLYMES